MKRIRVGAMFLSLLMSVSFTACGGKNTQTDGKTEIVNTTLGQELQDLDKAYKDGIIPALFFGLQGRNYHPERI